MKPNNIKIYLQIREDLAEHLLNLEIKDRFNKFTDISLINKIANEILKGSESEKIYFDKIISDFISSIGELPSEHNGKKIYYTIYHLHHINKKLDFKYLESWCNQFYNDYIINNKIDYNKSYVIQKYINEDGKLELVPMEVNIVNDNQIQLINI